jgi:CubicO group peptidase (beta-lactamase class C family)
VTTEENFVETTFQSSLPIKGYCHEDFQEVAETFTQNFEKYEEIGSSLCVVVDGEITVDLWAGHKNKERTNEWNEKTLSVAFSSTKSSSCTLCTFIDR